MLFKSFHTKSIGLTVIIAALALGAYVIAMRLRSWHEGTPYFRKSRLISELHQGSACDFLAPQGDFFAFAFGTPLGMSISNLSGRLVITNSLGFKIATTFNGERLHRANWLDDDNLATYAITIDADDSLQSLVQPAKRVHLQIDFDRPIPDGVSLWLTFVQTWRQYHQEL